MKTKFVWCGGVVKWYHRGLQNLWPEFDSQRPCLHMNTGVKQRLLVVFFIVVIIFLVTAFWEIYIPKNNISQETITYDLKKGAGEKDIALELQRQGIIKNNKFFRIYVILTFQYSKLQAGRYELSPSMSIVEIVKKFVSGNIIKNKITVIEGWDLEDIGSYLEDKNVISKKDFFDVTKKDWSNEFVFLSDKPKKLSLEGYIFPDTYYMAENATGEEFIRVAMQNFNKKLMPDLRKAITDQHRSIFQIITMASMLEKEVRLADDKKIVSGILWKRIKEGIPLQVDSTVNYITHKNDPKVTVKDTKIDSPYNTYKYYGLPLGPISNPGMDSIIAAIYPIKTDYWYYLSADHTGQTIFSKTLEEHNIAIAKYFK